jgi:chorismate mutase / prephenate dehydratase
MTKKHPDRSEPELSVFRKQIDDIDDQLIELLLERINIVSRVGEMKRRTAPGRCPIRPAREAEMVRRVVQSFEHTPFPPFAAASMWRMLIGASTSVEASLVVSVFTPERDHDLYWMAREYFGPFIPCIRQPHIKRVIGDVMDGKASVGIVPILRSADTTFWWTNLIQQGHDIPRVFARVPFIDTGVAGRDAPAALAIARITPEDSGDDNSLIVMEVDHNVSQHKLQTAFTSAKLEATWINIATLYPSVRHHLIEIKGFITPEHEVMASLLSGLGASVINVNYLGSYAIPINFNDSSTHESRPGLHAAGTAKK